MSKPKSPKQKSFAADVQVQEAQSQTAVVDQVAAAPEPAQISEAGASPEPLPDSQGDVVAAVPDPVAAAPVAQPDPVLLQPAEPLDAYIARVERAKLDQDVVAVAIAHPEVHADRVHPGTYGGIRLSNGPVGVTYSDGSKA